jgi:drug/metabolite transporter (DMT)-like permease
VIAGSIVGIFLFGGFVAQTIGMKYTTAGKNAFLTATNVVIVPFLAWTVNKKRPDMYSIVSAFLTLIGIGMLSLQKGFTIGLGDGLTLMCAVFFAAQIVAVGYFAVNTDPIILTIVQLAFTAVLSLVSAAIFEAAPKGFGIGSIRAMAYLVLFSTLLAFLIQNIAQKYTPPTHAAIIMCMESVFGSVFAVLMLHDVFSKKMIAGCLLIFFSVMLSETKLDFLHKKSTK